MTPEQETQIIEYREIVKTIPELWLRKRHNKKAALFIAQDGLCCLCGKAMDLRHGTRGFGKAKRNMATFEHVKVKSSGGTSAKENVPLSHWLCNQRRGVKDFETYRVTIAQNGGTPPAMINKKMMVYNEAREGDENAIEHLISKRLNLELYVQAVEMGWASNDKVDMLKAKLAQPIKVGSVKPSYHNGGK